MQPVHSLIWYVNEEPAKLNRDVALQSKVLNMSSVFRTKNLQDAGIDNVLFLEKSCRKMNTIFSAVQRQQRKSDVITSFGLTACSAVYYQVPHCRFLIDR
jgi:hypothetical protein